MTLARGIALAQGWTLFCPETLEVLMVHLRGGGGGGRMSLSIFKREETFPLFIQGALSYAFKR